MKTLFRILLGIGQTLMGGLVFSHLWNWFVIRKFPSMPHLNTMDAVGLLIVVGFPLLGLAMLNLRKELQDDAAKKGDKMDDGTAGIIITIVTTVLIYPAVLLGAWIWGHFIGG